MDLLIKFKDLFMQLKDLVLPVDLVNIFILSNISKSGFSFLTYKSIVLTSLLFSKFSTLNTSISISGTGLLIVVGVALETYKQLESQLVSRTYTKGRKGRR